MLSVAFLTSANLLAMGPGPSPVKVAKVVQKQAQAQQIVSGRVVGRSRSNIAPLVAGQVNKINVANGRWVRAGDVLFTLDHHEWELQKLELLAQKEVLGAQLEQAQKQLKLQSLEWQDIQAVEKAQPGSISIKESRQVQSMAVGYEGQVKKILAEKKHIEAKLKSIELTISRHHIKAPFAGQVMDRQISVGDHLMVGQRALMLINPRDIEVQLDCPSDYLLHTQRVGFDIRVWTKEPSKGTTLTQLVVLQSVNESSQTFLWSGIPTDDDHELFHGMKVKANLPLPTHSLQMLIPHAAILKNDVGSYVYKVVPGQQGNMVVPVKVKVLHRSPVEASIVSQGLREGDQVVVQGGERLFPMTPVQPQELSAQPSTDVKSN
jgi:membrane fusion protein (multidrug efflux system)